MKKLMLPKEPPLNYIYFGVFLAFMLILNIHHIFLISTDSMTPRLFFLLYALGETVIEVVALMLIAIVVRRYLPKIFFYIFIALSFIFLLIHLVDFVLVRIMDMSFWFALGIVFDEKLENFIEMLHLTGIDIRLWLLALPGLFITSLLGIVVYRQSHKFASKRPIQLMGRSLIKMMCLLPICLIALDVTVAHYVTEENYHRFSMALPWKGTLLGKELGSVILTNQIPAPPNEKEEGEKLQAIDPPYMARRPNVYLFIIESLREDFLTEFTAPAVHAFKTENFYTPLAFSNANATQISWYAIIHAKYPFYWSDIKEQKWKEGSIPLRIFKKLGYRINVYSGAQLKYYGLDQMMFGQKHDVLDTFCHYPHYPPKEAYESDLEAHRALLQDLKQKDRREGNLFIVFYDSTHFNYSWPKDFSAPFQPICQNITQLRLRDKKSDIEKIKNRYRNSIAFVDSLFAQFQTTLKEEGLYDESVIVFTGDHGEEFTEQGQLFHASHLSWMQTTVPIYYKFGKTPLASTYTTTSHIDVFPTLIHYLTGDLRFASLFDGGSLFSASKPTFEVCARYNGGRPPFEFFLHDGTTKMLMRFDQKKIFHSKKLHILGTKDGYDIKLRPSKVDWNQELLLSASEKLFTRKKH